MRDNQTMIDDLLTLGGNLFGNLLGARHEVKAQVKQRGEQLSQMLGLVSREEFDAAFAMLAKARLMQEELNDRLSVVEKRLNIATPVKKSTTVKTSPAASAAKSSRQNMKANLPSVKKDKYRGKRA